MRPVGCTLPQEAIPALDIRQRRSLDLEVEVAKERGSRRYIGQRQVIPENEGPACQHPIQQREVIGRSPYLAVDRNHVALRLGRAIEAPEHSIEEVRLERTLRPIHPSIGMRPLERVGAPKLRLTMASREVAQNCVRLPNGDTAVLDDGYAPNRVL